MRSLRACGQSFCWLAAVVTLAFTASPAFAHLGLRSGTPAAGSTLSTAPRELRLRFTERVESAIAVVTLTGPHGRIDLAELFSPPDSGTVLVAPIAGDLAPGVHTVSWRVPGADGHPVTGEYTFIMGETPLTTSSPALTPAAGPNAPGQTVPPAGHHVTPSAGEFNVESPGYAAVRWLTFVGLLGVIGVVAFRAVLAIASRGDGIIGPALTSQSEDRAARLGLWAVGIVAVAALLRLYAQSAALHGVEMAAAPELVGTLLRRTVWGWAWVLQIAGTVVAAVGFVLVWKRSSQTSTPGSAPGPPTSVGRGRHAARSASNGRAGPPADDGDGYSARPNPVAEDLGSAAPRTGGGWLLGGVAAVALALTPALSGHAVAEEDLRALAVLGDTLHVVGAGGWMGGLLVLLAVGVPAALRLRSSDRGPALAALVNAFSPTALFFAALTLGTGLFAAWLNLDGSLSALWESGYGRTLLLKLAFVSAVFFTGAYNWLRVRPALGTEPAAGRLRRSGVAELAAGIFVLAITAVLVASSPPEAEPSDGSSQSRPAQVSH